jgi:uncharacterized protein (DUF983 family)
MAELPQLILDGIRGRCPRCRRGALFQGYLKVVDRCPVCGLGFAGHDTGDGPAFFIILPLSILTAVLALLVEVKFEPPMWVHVLTWPLFIALAVGFALRPVKGIMIALQYRYRDVEHEHRT